ncbi:hypothetical protein GCM10010302_26320 [Streptomyces polychromogenes]|uniref:Uncharacterized protein n=1 Tax=Streptomyces polychromogenes TaxID=67342 RepID=A0ABP3EZX1_9ACTN
MPVRTSTQITPDLDAADAICRQRGLYDRVFPLRPVFDRQALNDVYAEGLLTDADMTRIMLEITPPARPPRRPSTASASTALA